MTNSGATLSGAGRLTDEHRQELTEGSGLSDETIRLAGIYSEHDKTNLAAILNRRSVSRLWAPALVFPYHDCSGAVVLQRVKPKHPPTDKKSGKPRKYFQPTGAVVRAYIPPTVHEKLTGDACRLLVTEGEKKALAATQAGFACIGLSGVDCWHKKGQSSLIPDLEAVSWKWREAFIVFDSDAATNDNVLQNERELASVLQDRGAKVRVVQIPAGADGAKQGVDDFLVAHGGAAFQKLLERADEPEAPEAGDLKTTAKNADPAEEARNMIAATSVGGFSRLRFWRGGWLLWKDGAYGEVPATEVRSQVVNAMNRGYFDVRSRYVGDVLEQLRAQSILSASVETPTWLGKAPEGFDPQECFASRKQVVHLPSLVSRKDKFAAPATPGFFTTSACQFDVDRSALKPAAWLRFLDELWGDDPESIDALQEWFGYLLTADTRQQKLLLVVGPKRSGKGTIARVLASLVGKSNVAAPTMHSLTTNFGLASLVGRSVAIISDARLSGRSDQSIVVERILSITGEDLQTVDRKHREPITCKLPTRFVILSNELPRLNDSSGAIVSRMILLETRRSFLGAEDFELTDKLLGELPGILLWAVDGWRRLQERGRLAQPDSGYESLAELNDLSSPVSAFLADRCIVDLREVTSKDDLFEAWKSWCERAGRGKFVGAAASFGRDLLAANSAIRSRRVGPRGERVQVYDGVGLKADFAT